MALRVISHYPAINAINVPKNASVKVVFNSGIVPQSVTAQTFSINDASSYTTKVGTVGVEYDSSGVCTTAVFQPYAYINGSGVVSPFTANKKYRVYLFNSPNSILSVGNEYLTTAYTFEFTVGTGVLSDPFPEGIPSGDLPTSGTIDEDGLILDSGLYVGLNYSGLVILHTYPNHQEPNIPTNTGSIRVLFNTDVLTSGVDLSGYVSLTIQDVLF